MSTILVTGGAGVVGTALVSGLERKGWRVRVLDIAATAPAHVRGDIRDHAAVRVAARDVAGIVHLAAVSRVGWGEDDPGRCRDINVNGTAVVAEVAGEASQWMLFVSSREVYGNPHRLPVVEDDPISPVNTYGRSKADGELAVAEARKHGLVAATVRLPSVYGSVRDIPDRVIPAFVRGAIAGNRLMITGANQLCDFLHVTDAVDGVVKAIDRLNGGDREFPTVHLASGRGTSLGELARLVKALAGSASEIDERPARSFDVKGFVGDASRARRLLGWQASVGLDDGLKQLIAAMRTTVG